MTSKQKALVAAGVVAIGGVFGYFFVILIEEETTSTVPPSGLILESVPIDQGVVISWTMDGSADQLQRSVSIKGPWINMPGATSSPIIVPANKPTEYFRLMRKPSALGSLNWVKGMICSNGPGYATSVGVDSGSNLLVSGAFAGVMDFGTGPIQSSGGSASSDGFIVKYNSAGAVIWGKVVGTNGADYAHAIALDHSDNVVVAGRYQGAVNFGMGVLTNAGSSDIFVLKYNSAGQILWQKRFGGPGSDIPEAGNTVTVDRLNNIYVTAKFQGTAGFGNITLVSAGSDDASVFKLNPAGDLLWAKRFGSSNIDVPTGIAFDSENVLVTGYFFNQTDLGGGLLLAAGGVNDTDILLAKYNGETGAFIWGRRFGNMLGDNGRAVAADAADNIFFTGLFRQTVDFGGETPLDSFANGGIFFVGLNSNGEYLWGKATGSGSTGDLGFGISVDLVGNVALTGQSASGIYFGGDQTLLGNGQPNFFLASFFVPSIGIEPTYRWAKMVGAGTTGASQGSSVVADGIVTVVGGLLGTLDFGGESVSAVGGYRSGWAAQYKN